MVKSNLVTAKSVSKRKIDIIVAVLVCVVAVVGLSVWWFAHNYAKDAARPLEVALSNGGAVKVCDSGDPGRGPDNYAPNYAALYEFAGHKEDAAKLVREAATHEGYSLISQQSPYSYISWYVDSSTKKSNYSGFSNGNVAIRFSVYGAGEKKLYCNSKPLQSDETHTAISLEVVLPSSK